jgi:UDP-glucose 4-epimerase
MKILVTGGAGYIGSHTCVELLNAGHDVVVVDDYSNSKPEASGYGLQKFRVESSGTCMMCDVRDRASSACRYLLHERPDAVIHFAGYKAVGESVARSAEVLRQQPGEHDCACWR